MAEQAPVVSNTTPLITLAGVGLLELLPALYGTITIATQVLHEYEAKLRAGDLDLRAASWLTVAAVTIPDDLAAHLDMGEAATIALAAEAGARLVILDERRGRRIALARGLPVIGTGAVLVEAKRQGVIPAVAPVLNAMITQGQYISTRLRATLLAAADEPATNEERSHACMESNHGRRSDQPGREAGPVRRALGAAHRGPAERL